MNQVDTIETVAKSTTQTGSGPAPGFLSVAMVQAKHEGDVRPGLLPISVATANHCRL